MVCKSVPRSGAAARIGSSAIRDLLHLIERPEVISLAGGLPSPDGFPVAAIADATHVELAEDPDGALQYATTEGHPPLRRWVAEQHPAPVEAAQVLVTCGSQQALDLVVRATVEPGEVVAVADPAYVGALQTFRLADASLAALPSDADGLCVDALADRLAGGLRPALLYVVANFDNPTGATLTAERRRELARLADRYGFLVVEDDPYGALRWSGRGEPALATLSERVVTLGTTSKVLAPGLRVGWVVAPAELTADLVTLKQAADLHTGGLAQRVVHRVLTAPGFLGSHLDRLRVRYRRQCEALLGALDAALGDRLELMRPRGGMFTWARFTDGTDSSALLPRALDHGVAFVPGAAFSVAAPHTDALRLSFATAAPAALAAAADRLAAALA